MPLVIPRSGTVVGSGDSIIHGFTAGQPGHPNAYFDLEYRAEIDALYHTEHVPAPAAGPGPDLLPPGTLCTRDHGNYTTVNLGADGQTAAALSSLWGNVTPYNPACIWVAVGCNDVSAGTDVNTFGGFFTSFITTALAGNPNIILVFVGILGFVAGNTAFDAATPAYNAKISAACAAHPANCQYVDVRASWLRDDPSQTTGLYVGCTSPVDDRHLSFNVGRAKMYGWIREYVSLQPASA